MAQVTDSLLAEFQRRVDAGRHINSTVHEEAQLLHAFRNRKRPIERELGAWLAGLAWGFLLGLIAHRPLIALFL